MKIRIVADSSANLLDMEKICPAGSEFAAVPLRIQAGTMEFADDASLNTQEMLRALKTHRGKSGSACPGTQDWLAAFGDADIVYGVAITSNLSGCYNAARLAAEEYMEKRPGARVFILDSLSTGPEMELILERYAALIGQGCGFDEICNEITAYAKRTRLVFSLESLTNMARNGRVSPAVAAAVGLLGIRVVCCASSQGTLEPLHKCRGEGKALAQLYAAMKKEGFSGGRVRLSHSFNPSAAEKLREMILAEYPDCDLRIRENGGLCCFYSEAGGLLAGYETGEQM